MEEMLVNLVGNLGFPIAVTVYMMVNMNSTIKSNTESTNALANLVQRLIDRMDGHDHE